MSNAGLFFHTKIINPKKRNKFESSVAKTFKILYFILAKFKNHTLFILFSVKYFKNTLLYDKIV